MQWVRTDRRAVVKGCHACLLPIPVSVAATSWHDDRVPSASKVG
jgi:hypothetical protein